MHGTSHGAAASIAAGDPRPARQVAIIGGGFSGTTLAIQLLRHAGDAPLRIVIHEPREELGAGVAYATRDYPYPLNVAAGQMSLDPAQPPDFLEFARDQGICAAPTDYLPRQLYGEYLRQRFAQAAAAAPAQVRARHQRARVLQLRQVNGGWNLWLDDGSAQRADEVVLALGNPPPAVLPQASPIAGTPHYIEDPWSIGTAAQAEMESVLLVGSGLTMIDAALRLAALRPRPRHIHVLSRHGLLPESQAAASGAHLPVDTEGLLSGARSIRALWSAARQAADGLVAVGRDWRELVNALRPHLPSLWENLAQSERARFLRHLRTHWEVHRHRAPPGQLAAIQSLQRCGVLDVQAGRLESLRLLDDAVEVQWRPRGKSRARAWLVDRVINCTGPASRITQHSDPLVQSLLAGGWIRPDVLGLGIDVAADGRVLGRDGRPVDRLHYVGPWLRARDWEATAVPELRAHAARLALRLLEQPLAVARGA